MSDRFKSNYKKFVTLAKKSNEEFATASDAEKRVIIARDALAHAAVGRLMPTCGTYGTDTIYPDTMQGQTVSNEQLKNLDLREIMVEGEYVCQACARGGLVYSAILRRNNVKGVIFDGETPLSEFPWSMMQEIETAFEADNMHSLYRWQSEHRDEFLNLLQQWRYLTKEIFAGDFWSSNSRYARFGCEDEFRFDRVMRWIIDHYGEFDILEFLRAEVRRFPAAAHKAAKAAMKRDECV